MQLNTFFYPVSNFLFYWSAQGKHYQEANTSKKMNFQSLQALRCFPKGRLAGSFWPA